MNKSKIIRELAAHPNTTLRVSVSNPKQITPVGTLYNCIWIFQLTNDPKKTLEELIKENNGVCSFQASWWTKSIKQAVETCIEFSENSFEGKGCYNFELHEQEFDIHDLIYVVVYINYTYMPCLIINAN